MKAQRPTRYLEIVLTAIAVALWVIAARPFVAPSPAEAGPQVVDVNVVGIAGGRLSPTTHGGLRPSLPIAAQDPVEVEGSVRVENAVEIGAAVAAMAGPR